MSMTIEALAKQAFDCARRHGWHDEDRRPSEIVALIHSEWSECLEEARAGRPLVWYRCGFLPNDQICDYINDDCEIHGTGDCERTRGKPEGIAVELIDGCIRILDYFGKVGCQVSDKESGTLAALESTYNNEGLIEKTPDALCDVIALLHLYTARAFKEGFDTLNGDVLEPSFLLSAMAVALTWVHKQGIDPERLLLEKHAYNETRPYKHGKRF